MLIKGSDDLYYLAIGDLQGNIIREPFQPTAFSGYPMIVSDGYLAYYNNDEGIAYVYDFSKETADAQVVANIGSRIDGLRFLGNDLIAIEIDDDERTEIYNFNGLRIA